jgi:drug/metabolite transporter (DMT)-like permease
MMAMLLAVVCYSINDALIKWLSDSYHPMQIIFCRSLFVLVLPLGMTFHKKSWKTLKSTQNHYHAFRALITALSVALYVYSFGHLPLADAYAIAYVSPFFMALFSIPLLGEKVEFHGWVAIGIGLCGILIMTRPGSRVLSWGGLSACLAGIFYALSLVMSRKLSRTESDVLITLWFVGACFVLSVFFMPFCWKMPSATDWLLFAALGAAGGVAIMAMTRAFSLAPAFVLGPLDYLSFVCGTVIGYVVWGDVPDAFVLGGAFLLVLGGLYLVSQEARRKPLVLGSVLQAKGI